MSSSSRYTAVLANFTVSVILMLLLLILAPLLLTYTIHLQLPSLKPSRKLGFCFSHVPSARFFSRKSAINLFSQKQLSGGHVAESITCGLVSAFQTQTLVKTTTIKAECGRSEPATTKYLAHDWRTQSQHKIHSSPHFTSFAVTDPVIAFITPIAP